MRYKFPVSKALIRRMGHRGAFLLFLALLDVIYGLSLCADPGPLKPLNLILPINAWADIWMAIGVFLFTGAFLIKDKYHFAVATLLKFIWAAVFFDAWYIQGFSRGWVQGVIWAAFACVVLVISSWPEAAPFKMPRQRPHRDE